MNEKKLIIGVTAAILLIVAIVAIVSLTKDNNQGNSTVANGTTASQNVINNGANDVSTTNYWDNIDIFEGDGNEAGGSTETNTNSSIELNGDNDQTIEINVGGGENTTDNNNGEGDVIQIDFGDETGNVQEKTTAAKGDKNETGKNNQQQEKTTENKETVSEEYPGQNDGWSPIVSPDDLN